MNRNSRILFLSIPLIIFLVALFLSILGNRSHVEASHSLEGQSMVKRIGLQAKQLCEHGLHDSALIIGNQTLDRAIRDYGEIDTTVANIYLAIAPIFKYHKNCPKMIKFYKRGLEIIEQIYGPKHPKAFDFLYNLAKWNRILCRFDKAKAYLDRSLIIADDFADRRPGIIANLYCELGILFYRQARYDSAIYYLEKSRRLYVQKNSNPERIAYAINNLANVYNSQGRYREAEEQYKKSAVIRLNAFGPDWQHLGEPLNNLGGLCATLERYPEAERYYKHALFVRTNHYGSDWHDLVYSLNGLGEVYLAQKRYNEAHSLFMRALEICQKSFGNRHSKVSDCYRSLADLARCQGRFSMADSLYHQALAINEGIYGPDHPVLAEDYRCLARNCASLGNYETSLFYFEKMLKGMRCFFEHVFPAASIEQKMKFISEYPLIDYSLLSLAVHHGSDEIIRSALEMVLRGEAFVVDVLSDEGRIANDSDDPKLRKLLDKLSDVYGALSSMTLAGPVYFDPFEYQDSLEYLSVLKDSLEAVKSTLCNQENSGIISFGAGLSDIGRCLGKNEVLWEYIYYEPYDFDLIGNEPERTRPGRYLAFVLTGQGQVLIHDLGEAKKTDSLIIVARDKLYDAGINLYPALTRESEAELNRITSQIYNLVFAPLEAGLDGRDNILVSPDGQLNLIPFEILPCRGGKYAVENYTISYLSSGRDLLKFDERDWESDWVLLMADPDFNLNRNENQKPTNRSHGLRDIAARSISNTQVEAESIADMIKMMRYASIREYYGENALEDVFKEMESSPAVIHIATHPFFDATIPDTKRSFYQNPLLHMGIKLAGGNRFGENQGNEEDGILTAFEISGLNLTDVELAVLSACETGVGMIINGEGVFSLRRAFQLAGAQAVLMSLWQVPDRETCELMVDFYRNWLGGMSKRNAFRWSILNMIKNLRDEYDMAHPFYWGAFVLTGNPN